MEVDKATDKSVWVDGRRVARQSDGTWICDSFEDAKAWLVGVANRDLESAISRAEDAKANMAKVDAMIERDVETRTERW